MILPLPLTLLAAPLALMALACVWSALRRRRGRRRLLRERLAGVRP